MKNLKLWITSFPHGKAIIVEVIEEQEGKPGRFYIIKPDGRTDTTIADILFYIPAQITGVKLTAELNKSDGNCYIWRHGKSHNYMVLDNNKWLWGCKSDAFQFETWKEAEEQTKLLAFTAFVTCRDSIVPPEYRNLEKN